MKERGIHMGKISMIGVDLGKRSLQLRGIREDGSAVFRRKVSLERFLAEVSGHGPCRVAMEACGSARHWGRELQSMGFEVRLVPPTYVKRYKNDAADAEAVCEMIGAEPADAAWCRGRPDGRPPPHAVDDRGVLRGPQDRAESRGPQVRPCRRPAQMGLLKNPSFRDS